MKKISVFALIALVAAVAAVHADIIPSFGGTSPGSGTNTVWNYSINITTGQQVMTGDFFTIYDFGPFVAGSAAQPAGWTFSSSLLTAPPPNTNPTDNPSLANLTWTYGGVTIPPNTNLSGFSVTQATSQFQELPNTQSGFFAAMATNTNGGGGSKISNVGRVPVPVPIPEPTTLSLLALAGVGSALRAIRRRK